MNEIFKKAKSLKSYMKTQGVAFNKNLGQNFLMNAEILEKIVESAQIQNCGVLEVGAGLGNLTELLLKFAKKVVAVELDAGLFAILKKQLIGFKNLKLINYDVLKLNLQKLFDQEFSGLNVKICANLPYYITSKFIANVLNQRLKNLNSLTLMVQKEAAQRFCAQPGSKNCGAITYLVYYYSKPELLFDVSKHNFCPAPKVDSSVINLVIKKKESMFQVSDEQKFFQFICAAFSQRRKFLVSPLSKAFNLDKVFLKEVLVKAGLRADVRAQELNLEQFVQFFNEVCHKIL